MCIPLHNLAITLPLKPLEAFVMYIYLNPSFILILQNLLHVQFMLLKMSHLQVEMKLKTEGICSKFVHSLFTQP